MLTMCLLGVDKNDVGIVEVAPLTACLGSGINAMRFECVVALQLPD